MKKILFLFEENVNHEQILWVDAIIYSPALKKWGYTGCAMSCDSVTQ